MKARISKVTTIEVERVSIGDRLDSFPRERAGSTSRGYRYTTAPQIRGILHTGDSVTVLTNNGGRRTYQRGALVSVIPVR